LDQIKDVLSPEFAALFASLADIEETAYSRYYVASAQDMQTLNA
jgi:hypothetical protein